MSKYISKEQPYKESPSAISISPQILQNIPVFCNLQVSDQYSWQWFYTRYQTIRAKCLQCAETFTKLLPDATVQDCTITKHLEFEFISWLEQQKYRTNHKNYVSFRQNLKKLLGKEIWNMKKFEKFLWQENKPTMNGKIKT
jgi:hypothetical protein